MVSTKEIVAANAAFAAKRTSEKVFVLTGATSGIGAATMQKLASMVDTATFYVAGRSAPRFSPLRAKVEALNPNIRIVFFECNVALLADMDAFSGHIAASEKSVDYLCMSQGTLPFTGARCTLSPASLPDLPLTHQGHHRHHRIPRTLRLPLVPLPRPPRLVATPPPPQQPLPARPLHPQRRQGNHPQHFRPRPRPARELDAVLGHRPDHHDDHPSL